MHLYTGKRYELAATMQLLQSKAVIGLEILPELWNVCGFVEQHPRALLKSEIRSIVLKCCI
jgi:hypothetical protein